MASTNANSPPASDDDDTILFLRSNGHYYLRADVNAGINPLDWARLTRRIGRLSPDDFYAILHQFDQTFR